MSDLIPCPVCGKPREQSNRLSVFNAMSRCPDDRCPLSVWMDNASFERLSHNALVAEAGTSCVGSPSWRLLVKYAEEVLGFTGLGALEEAVRAARDCRGNGMTVRTNKEDAS